MLKLIYDEDRRDDLPLVRYVIKQLRLLLVDRNRKKLDGNDRYDLSAAVKLLEDYANMLDNAKETCDNIGNMYKFHITEQCAYDEGYNAAIREVLSLMKKGDNNAEDI